MQIEKNISLAPYTTFRIGGNAEYFAVAETIDDIKTAVQFDTRTFILGNGSNLLVSSNGVKGLVLKISLREITHENNIIISDSGVLLPTLSAYAKNNALSGLEWAGGVPGTVGGACKMNAGAFGGDIASILAWIEILREDRVVRLTTKECNFSYRNSGFLDSDIILKAAFRLTNSTQNIITSAMHLFAQQRSEKQPKGFSAGSVFKGADKPAGYYIDKAGLKNSRIGGAIISEKHANFILNTNNATSTDVLQLIAFIKNKVYDRFGITLQEEIQFVGM